MGLESVLLIPLLLACCCYTSIICLLHSSHAALDVCCNPVNYWLTGWLYLALLSTLAFQLVSLLDCPSCPPAWRDNEAWLTATHARFSNDATLQSLYTRPVQLLQVRS